MKYFLLPAISLAVMLTTSLNARAALVLNIDLTTEELFLTGSDTGSARSNILGSYTDWNRSNVNDPQPEGSGDSVNLINGLDVGSTFTSFLFQTGADRNPDTGTLQGTVSISAIATSGAETTLTGNGIRISYAGMNSTFKNSIQSLASDSDDDFTLSEGSGFSPISISVISVPEPSSCLFLAGGILAIIGRRRRQH
ncbi:PEP-CTERM sorting domain-containing protein [Verrucomicrobiaceae bacterium N1E253]|uniref:PEP-CTERM sorting domain-containing protein n=1 Tax=Oceaniferula marina TaxID=2748318 RepID=A0A851GJC4_9BACT|nr:PEP-CTERM sorting domain-containing protein [Oceaniferula marina]NWK55971.1 PEP-CTERM sorting domain-containing protein [Oceaniferula marina]